MTRALSSLLSSPPLVPSLGRPRTSHAHRFRFLRSDCSLDFAFSPSPVVAFRSSLPSIQHCDISSTSLQLRACCLHTCPVLRHCGTPSPPPPLHSPPAPSDSARAHHIPLKPLSAPSLSLPLIYACHPKSPLFRRSMLLIEPILPAGTQVDQPDHPSPCRDPSRTRGKAEMRGESEWC